MIHFDSEKDLEDVIWNNLRYFDELPEGEEKFRQPRLGDYGVADIITIQHCATQGVKIIHVHLIELKNTPLKYEHIGQCARYKRFFEKANETTPFIITFSASLIGLKTFPVSSDLEFIAQEVEWLDVYELGIDPASGITLNIVEGWEISADQGVPGDELVEIMSQRESLSEFLENKE